MWIHLPQIQVLFSPPNTGFISVPSSDAVLIFCCNSFRTSVCRVMCIVLGSSFGGVACTDDTPKYDEVPLGRVACMI